MIYEKVFIILMIYSGASIYRRAKGLVHYNEVSLLSRFFFIYFIIIGVKKIVVILRTSFIEVHFIEVLVIVVFIVSTYKSSILTHSNLNF